MVEPERKRQREAVSFDGIGATASGPTREVPHLTKQSKPLVLFIVPYTANSCAVTIVVPGTEI